MNHRESLLRHWFFALVICAAPGCGGESGDVANIRRTCALQISCTPPAMGMSGSACVQAGINSLERVSMLSAETNYELQCAQNATSCATYQSCMARNHAGSYCAANPGVSCDGTVLVGCAADAATVMPPPIPEQTFDCAGLNAQCRASTGTGAGHAVCTNGNTCASNAPPRCDGAHLITCDPQLMVEAVTDCGATGNTCDTVSIDFGFGMPMMVGTCVPSTTVCLFPRGQPPAPQCDGTSLVECVPLAPAPPRTDGMEEGRVRRTDCTNALLQGTCVTVGAGTSTALSMCAPVNNECAPDSPDRCNGNAVEYCVNGHYEATDCGSLGLQRCVQVTHDRAVCVAAGS